MLNHGVTWLTVIREGVAGEHRNLEKMVGKLILLFFFQMDLLLHSIFFWGPSSKFNFLHLFVAG